MVIFSWQEIEYETKEGYRVRIKPSGVKPKITSFEDVSFYHLESDDMRLGDATDLEIIAAILDSFSRVLAADREARKRLRMYEDREIAPYTRRDVERAREIGELCYKATDFESATEWPDKILAGEEKVAAELGEPLEVIQKLNKLSHNLVFYEDWYDELYGEKPDYGKVLK